MIGFEHFDARPWLEATTINPQKYLYATCPIDLWEPWVRFSEFLIRLGHIERQLAEANLEKALAAARQLSPVGWEGNFREGPFVSGVPTYRETGLAYMVAWKQDKNQTTFVASPQELPWLEAHYYSRAVLVGRNHPEAAQGRHTGGSDNPGDKQVSDQKADTEHYPGETRDLTRSLEGAGQMFGLDVATRTGAEAAYKSGSLPLMRGASAAVTDWLRLNGGPDDIEL